ncbi:MAG: hypothetical protein GY870_00200 [archaeon]|nr:hypothetical protein [archaeon]
MFGKKKDKKEMKVGKSVGKVILTKKVYRTMIASCVRFANSRIPEADWLEIYGILIGRNEGNNVIVSEAHPITHTTKKGHILKVSYDSPDYVDAALIEEEAICRDPPEFMVGWYHSHPGIKIMFSQDDVKNQLGFQTNNPLAIGPVFNQVRLLRQVELAKRKGDPSSQLTNDPGFKIFRLQDPTKGQQASYDEVEFEFSDAEITPAFIEEAKAFAGEIGRILPPNNLIQKTTERFEKQKAKLLEIYSGSESYIKTLIKKGDTTRIPGVVDTQKAEMDKIIGPMQKDIEILKEIMHYVEYKERGETLNTFNTLFEDWKQFLIQTTESFNALKTRF